MKRHTSSKTVSVAKTPASGLGATRNKVKYDTAKKVKKMEKHNALKGYLIDYSTNSNLHGLKYIGEKERTFVEKIFWTIMFLCCVVVCARQIQNIYLKWKDNPVIIGFDENLMPVWKIPFPAVTICSETKAMQTKYNFTENFHLYYNLTDTERFYFEDISMVCEAHLAPRDGRKFSNGTTVVSHIKEVCPSINETCFGCQWLNESTNNCETVWSPVLTEQGLCFTFNTMSAEEMLRLDNLHSDYEYLEKGQLNYAITWSLENGYPDGAPLDTYPRRGSDAEQALRFLLKHSETDLDYLCRGPVLGFKIYLNNPAELPSASRRYYRAPLSKEVQMSVQPKIMTTSAGLLDYNPNKRKCYFPSERYLRYFRVYTQANCDMECLSNFTYSRCGCVHFGMLRSAILVMANSVQYNQHHFCRIVAANIHKYIGARSTYHWGSVIIYLNTLDDKYIFDTVPICVLFCRYDGSNMTVCNAGSILCVQKARVELQTAALHSESMDGTSTLDTSSQEIAQRCMCKPACVSIEYETHVSQADFDWRVVFDSYRTEYPPELNDTVMTRAIISLKDAQFITSRRSELYGQTDFLANCGGLLGLFLGFSVLSIVEILYFFTLRIICAFWKKRFAKSKSHSEHLNTD